MSDIWFWMWVGLAAFLMVAEIFTAGFFMLPLGLGAAVAAIANFAGLALMWQWVVFLGVSTVAFVSLRRFAERITHEPPVKTGVDRLIGKVGIVVEELTPNTCAGQVRIEREEWRADAPGCPHIPQGARVVVEGVEGTHLVVRPLAEG